MQNIFSYLNSILEVYWGQSRYQLLLYLSIGIILLKEKEAWKKIVFGWYGIVCFIGLMNPVTVKITSRIWGESVAYYCRQFSLIPNLIVMSYGIVLLYTKVHEKKRMILVALMILFICMSGNNIYQESWYTMANNYEKIPKDVVEIANYLKKHESMVKIAVPTSIGGYLRQYSNVIQSQGRVVYDSDMENELQNENPNVYEIMSKAGESGCDYLVAQNYKNVEGLYKEAGYILCLKTDNYVVYKVESVDRWQYKYDDLNRLEACTFWNSNNIISNSPDGYAIKKIHYNDKGEIQSEYYYDANGIPVVASEGQCGVIYEYDNSGNVIQITYCDEKAKPVIAIYGYAIARYEYDKKGNRIKVNYYDEDDKPMALETGQYGERYEYNENGKIKRKIFVDANDMQIQLSIGYSSIVYEYDKDGNKIDEKFYDINGKEVDVH